jgi:hypothetical protein
MTSGIKIRLSITLGGVGWMRTGDAAGDTPGDTAVEAGRVAVLGSASGEVVDSGEVVGIGGCVQALSGPPTMAIKTSATVNVQRDRFIIAAHCTPFGQSCTALALVIGECSGPCPRRLSVKMLEDGELSIQ